MMASDFFRAVSCRGESNDKITTRLARRQRGNSEQEASGKLRGGLQLEEERYISIYKQAAERQNGLLVQWSSAQSSA